jgi:Fe-S-cluster-containing hydrogenase component 2
MKIATPEALAAAGADASFKTIDAVGKEFAGRKFTIQIFTADCVGCTLCSVICPARKKDADGNKTEESALNENRYRMLKMANPTQCDALMEAAQKDVGKSWKFLQSRFSSLQP